MRKVFGCPSPPLPPVGNRAEVFLPPPSTARKRGFVTDSLGRFVLPFFDVPRAFPRLFRVRSTVASCFFFLPLLCDPYGPDGRVLSTREQTSVHFCFFPSPFFLVLASPSTDSRRRTRRVFFPFLFLREEIQT